MRETVLFFGSFNPPHNGHTAVARYVAEQDFCGELWFVVSPQNPLKESSGLAPEGDRLEMVRIAAAERLAGLPVVVCDAEFSMPRPSYTIDTLRELGGRFPDRRFALLAGTDILDGIGRWKDAGELVSNYRFYIYPRMAGDPAPERLAGCMTYLGGAPRFGFSSTDVRLTAENGGDIAGMVSPGVARYIKEHGLWKTRDR